MGTLIAVLLYVLAAVVAVFAIGLSAALVSEYGPAEGYANLAMQVLPIIAGGLLLAGGLGWAGTRMMHRRTR